MRCILVVAPYISSSNEVGLDLSKFVREDLNAKGLSKQFLQKFVIIKPHSCDSGKGFLEKREFTSVGENFASIIILLISNI